MIKLTCFKNSKLYIKIQIQIGDNLLEYAGSYKVLEKFVGEKNFLETRITLNGLKKGKSILGYYSINQVCDTYIGNISKTL